MDTISKRLRYLAAQRKISQATVADELGIDRQAVNRWWTGRVKNIRDDNLAKLADYFGCRFEWLKEGKQPVYLIDSDNIQKYSRGFSAEFEKPPNQKIKATIEPGPNRKKRPQTLEQSIANNMESTSSNTSEDFSLSEMVSMTVEVLQSETVYRSALASNVRAFYKAVKNEEEMDRIITKLEQMEEKDRAMSEKINRLEEMLISLGATPPQKRAAAE